MNLLQLNPDLLDPNPWNTNSVGPENMEKLCASLERNGWVRPVLARQLEDGRYQILGGQHRVEAARSLGHDTVPVIVLSDVSERKAKEIGLIDNARYGEDDAIGLAELLNELGGREVADFLPLGDADLAALGTEISDDDIDSLLNEDDQPDPDDKPARPAKTHDVMRFKVPLGDADDVREVIEQIMKEQGFTGDDSLTNAGDALVWMVRNMGVST